MPTFWLIVLLVLLAFFQVKKMLLKLKLKEMSKYHLPAPEPRAPWRVAYPMLDHAMIDALKKAERTPVPRETAEEIVARLDGEIETRENELASLKATRFGVAVDAGLIRDPLRGSHADPPDDRARSLPAIKVSE